MPSGSGSPSDSARLIVLGSAGLADGFSLIGADVYADAATRVIGLYQRRLETVAEPAGAGAQLHKVARAERELQLEGLRAERETIFALAREQKISDATSRKLVREIDLLEARHR